MYNLLEYSANYFDTTGSLSFYSKDGANNSNANIASTNTFEYFKYKTKVIESKAAANGILENATIVLPLKYLSNFLRLLEMLLINCKVELKLKLTKHCVLATGGNDDDDANSNNFISPIKCTKLYVPVVTSSAKDNQKVSTRLSKGSERSVYWNEYKTKRGKKNTTDEYRYFLDSNFVGVKRLFVLV